MMGFVQLEEVVLRLRLELRNVMKDYKLFLGHSSWEVILYPNTKSEFEPMKSEQTFSRDFFMKTLSTVNFFLNV